MDYFARLPVLFSAKKKQADSIVMRSRDDDDDDVALLPSVASAEHYSFKGGPTSSIFMRWHQGLMDAWVTLNALKKYMLPIACNSIEFFSAHSS